MKRSTHSRRAFLGQSAAAISALAFPAIIPASARAAGDTAPNSRIGVGLIGSGPQGCGVMGNFLRNQNARVLAVCDIQAERRESAKARVDHQYGDSACDTYNDFRELLERSDIDAVIIASPDHWHVLHGIYAARAGKDMYLEKPMGLCAADNQALRDAIHRHKRVFQYGTQQRSSENFRIACELVRNGYIGELRHIEVGAPPSIPGGEVPPEPVPPGVDYELWLGPAPYAPFSKNRIINEYWWHNTDYALGFVAGWGIHHVDIAQWGCDMDLSGPVEAEGTGEFPTEGFRNCATSWDIRFRYANGVTMHYTDENQLTHGINFIGSEGRVYVRRSHLETDPKSLMDVKLGPDEIHLYESNDHAGNFLECVRSRAETVCPIDIAVRSDMICQLSDIAMRLKRPLKWDPAVERFIGDDEANARLTRPMREPWKLYND